MEAFYHDEIVNVSVCSVLSSVVFYEDMTVNVKTCTRSKDFSAIHFLMVLLVIAVCLVLLMGFYVIFILKLSV